MTEKTANDKVWDEMKQNSTVTVTFFEFDNGVIVEGETISFEVSQYILRTFNDDNSTSMNEAIENATNIEEKPCIGGYLKMSYKVMEYPTTKHMLEIYGYDITNKMITLYKKYEVVNGKF